MGLKGCKVAQGANIVHEVGGSPRKIGLDRRGDDRKYDGDSKDIDEVE